MSTTRSSTKRKEAPVEEEEAAVEETVEKKNKPEPRRQFPEHLNAADHSQFDSFLFEILLYRSTHQNFNVSKDKYPQLHAWLQHLKREYKTRLSGAAGPSQSQLTDEQVQVLEYLHIPVTARGDDHWNRYYELLKQYKERHGHVLVPRLCEIPGLGDWVTDQRRQYKAHQQGQSSQMSAERHDKLEALGFAWTVRNRPEWETRYNELLEYKKANGDCKVPQHYKPNKALGKWVAKQREQWKLLKAGKHSFLTPYRLEKLEQAGFCWQVRTALDTEVRMVMATGGVAPVAASAESPAGKADDEAVVDTEIHASVVDQMKKEEEEEEVEESTEV